MRSASPGAGERRQRGGGGGGGAELHPVLLEKRPDRRAGVNPTSYPELCRLEGLPRTVKRGARVLIPVAEVIDTTLYSFQRAFLAVILAIKL